MRSTTVKAFRYFGVGRESHRAKIKEEIKHVVCEMREYQGEPFDPSDLCSISICNVMCAIAFGKRYDYQDQDLLQLVNRFHEIFRLAGGVSVINVFPFLRYLPCDALGIQIETSTKMYTPFFNRIKLTIWTICAFRVLNPRQ